MGPTAFEASAACTRDTNVREGGGSGRCYWGEGWPVEEMTVMREREIPGEYLADDYRCGEGIGVVLWEFCNPVQKQRC